MTHDTQKLSIAQLAELVDKRQLRYITRHATRGDLHHLEIEPGTRIVRIHLNSGRIRAITPGTRIGFALRILWAAFWLAAGIAGCVSISLTGWPGLAIGLVWLGFCLGLALTVEYQRDSAREYNAFLTRYSEQHGHEPPSSWWAS